MSILFVIFFALIAISTDIAVYKHLVYLFPNKKWIRQSYLGWAVTLNIVVLVALLLIRRLYYESGTLLPLMWIIWSFVTYTIAKLTYLIVSSPDYFMARKRKGRKMIFIKIGFVLGLVVIVTFIWGASLGRLILRTEEIEIRSSRIPDSFDGYRIVQFSDLHLGNYARDNNIIERLVERINSLNPDLIVFTGDIVNSNAFELTDRYMAVLSQLRATDGVYTIWGNHDLGMYVFDGSITPEENVRMIQEKINMMGWTLLENSSIYIHRGTDSISISGVGFPRFELHSGLDIEHVGYEPVEAYAMVNPEDFNVMLAHTPNVWDDILAGYPADLTLSGHVHAMQLKLNFFGTSVSPAQLMYKYWSGLYSKEERYLYVNDGIGYVVYPMRIGTRPEITVITLRQSQPDDV